MGAGTPALGGARVGQPRAGDPGAGAARGNPGADPCGVCPGRRARRGGGPGRTSAGARECPERVGRSWAWSRAGSFPPVPLPAPLWQLLLLAAPSRLLPQHMVPPEPAPRVPSGPCLALPSLEPLPCPTMSLTGAVASLLRRPGEHRGDVGCEARQGRRRRQQHQQRRRWGGPGEWGEDRPPPGPAGSGEVVAKSRARLSCLLGPGERFSTGRKRRVSAAKQRPWLPLLPGSPRKLAVLLLPVTPQPPLALLQLGGPGNDPLSWGFVVSLSDSPALGWRSPLLSWLSQAGCLPKGFSF